MKRVTMRDVAVRAGVSIATVSRVLNDLSTISDETKRRVRAVCAELNYLPDFAARGLSGHATHMLGLIVPDVSNPYFSGMATAIGQAASESGYQVLLSNSLHIPERELEVIGGMLSQQVDGLLISACSPEQQARRDELMGHLPCVYLGSNHGTGCSAVEVDNESGACQAVQYLLRLGHRDIVFLGGRQGSSTLAARLRGYERMRREAGFTGAAITAPDGTRGLRQWSYQRALELFRSGGRPDAIIAYSDMIALKVLEAAEECGLRAPEGFSILGFDNIYYGAFPRIRLTSISQRKIWMGRLAVERLLEKIAGDAQVTEDILPAELVIRSTCRRQR